MKSWLDGINPVTGSVLLNLANTLFAEETNMVHRLFRQVQYTRTPGEQGQRYQQLLPRDQENWPAGAIRSQEAGGAFHIGNQ